MGGGGAGHAAVPPRVRHSPPAHIPDLTNNQQSAILEYLMGIVATADQVPEGRAYFAGRGLDPATIHNADVRLFDPATWRVVMRHMARRYGVEALIATGLVKICHDGKPRDVFHCWYRSGLTFMVMPYFAQERIVYLKGRVMLSKSDAEARRTPRYLNVLGNTPLYNADALQGHTGAVYICEGEIDTMTLVQMGYCAVGVPGARAFKRHWCHLFAGYEVYLALDGDAAGAAGAQHISRLFTRAGLPAPRVLPIPAGLDINSLFLMQPAAA